MTPTGVIERPAELPQVDPRMRDRWVRARRQEGRRRLRLVVAAGVVAAVVAAAAGVAESPLLAVRHVVVRGASHETPAQVVAASGLGSHPPMISFDATASQRRIEAMPWVSSAQVSRQWPNAVGVRITERTAVAVVPMTSGATPGATLAGLGAGSPTALVDATGRVLADATGAVPGLPVVLGIAKLGRPGTWLLGTTRGAVRASLATPLDAVLQLATELPPAVSASVVSLQADAGGLTGTIEVAGPPPAANAGGRSRASSEVQIPVFFGDSSDLPAKIVALQALMAQEDLSDVTEIDVSDSQRLNLTTTSPDAIVSTTAGG